MKKEIKIIKAWAVIDKDFRGQRINFNVIEGGHCLMEILRTKQQALDFIKDKPNHFRVIPIEIKILCQKKEHKENYKKPE